MNFKGLDVVYVVPTSSIKRDEKRGNDMQRESEELENDPEHKLEEKQYIAERCARPRVTLKKDKHLERFVLDMVDKSRRANAREIATIQDKDRHPVSTNRYDQNPYSGGPGVIRDVCFIEKRKVR